MVSSALDTSKIQLRYDFFMLCLLAFAMYFNRQWFHLIPSAPNIASKKLTRFNKIAIQGTPQMAADNDAISLSRVNLYYSKCNLPLL